MSKPIIAKLLACATAFATTLPLMADTETVDGIEWTYTVSDGKAEVGCSHGSVYLGFLYGRAVSIFTTGTLTIPSTLGGYPVTSIGDGAFGGCSGLTSVTIPDSVTSIGDSAFSGCSGLTSVTIPDSVTSIVDYAFYNCSGLTGVTIPDGVTSIGHDAFYRTPFYDNQPDGLIVLGKVLYKVKGSCPAMVTIPDGVMSIGDKAFYYCDGLMSVTIPTSVTSIGYDAFACCDGLTNVTIPDGVMSIGDKAFWGCSGLTNVVIGSGVTNIGYGAFLGCSGLLSFAVAEGNTAYKSVFGLLLTKDGKTLVSGVNGSVTIPDGVTSIVDYAFYDYSGLTSVTIPNSVTNIGIEAFADTPFSGNQLAGPVVFGKVLYAMYGSCPATVTIPDSVTSIGNRAFYYCSELTSVTIPDSVTSIGGESFRCCRGLTNVVIGSSVASIEGFAFEGCSGLTSVTIPTSVTSIEYDAFAWCDGLTNVTIPDGVMSIGDEAFWCCSGLTNVVIGSGVTNIERFAFSSCSGLLSFSVAEGNTAYKSVSGLLLTKDGKTLVAGVNGNVTIPDGVTGIGDHAFSGCSGLSGVTIPGSVTSIGDGAFGGCSGLTSVTIPDGVTSIGNDAFFSCDGLTSVTIPGSVTRIGELAFFGCSSLTSVTIPGSVTRIGELAFYGCSSLTSVTIPDSVTSIRDYAFYGCSDLTSVTIPSSVTSIRDYAFYGTALATVHVAMGDTDRVKAMISGSGYDVSGITFVEDGGSSGGNPDFVTPDPVTPCYKVIGASDITAPYAATKAVTLFGAVYDGCDVVGIVEFKLGKVNAKKKTSKVSGSVTTLDGKKYAIKAINLTGVDGTAPKAVSLEVKGLGMMAVTIGGTRFAGSLGTWHVQSANVGGNWTRAGAKVHLAATSTSLPSGTLEEFLPDGETVIAKGGKWKFANAAGVKWAKPKKGAALPEIYDAASDKGLVVDTAGGKTNLSGIKLSYTPKKGVFKGSFKVYALEGVGAKTTLKKYTVNVSGVVVDSVGYGQATLKKPAAAWAVRVD